jgi:acetyl esterase
MGLTKPIESPAFTGLSAQAKSALEEMGPRWGLDINANRQKVLDIYTPVLTTNDKSSVKVFPAISYGEHSRHQLDIYQPITSSSTAAKPKSTLPVIVFVHGGAFLRGNMNSNAEIYGNVPRYFARHGFLGINLEYRLAPEAAYPSGAQDIAAAISWIKLHIADFGGNPQHIILVGHSAGGAHAASYAVDPLMSETSESSCSDISGLVLISARLRADVLPGNPNAAGVKAYWGDDSANYDRVSPVTHADKLNVASMVVVAEFENPYLDTYGAEFFFRITQAAKHRHRFLQVLKHNHTSIVAHLDTEDQSLGPALIDFIASTQASNQS